MLTFFRTNVEPIDQVQSSLSKIFPMLLAYCKQMIQNQLQTVRRAVTVNVCGRKSSCELFSLATTHAKLANSGSGEMLIVCDRIRYFFNKRAVLSLSLLEN